MSQSSEQNEETIRRFVEAWSRLDAAELAAYFTEDGTYHNMPAAPVVGRAQVERFIKGFTASWTETTWDLIHIASDGDRVFTERLDRTKAGEKGVDLPCLGIFEMEDGKIKVWRDYFDMATFAKGMS
jgi:limonene-1,2-epoxide hydrolase